VEGFSARPCFLFLSVTNALSAHANPIHHSYSGHDKSTFLGCVFYFCQHCCSYSTRETTLMDTLVNVGKVQRDGGIHFLCASPPNITPTLPPPANSSPYRPLLCPLCLSILTHPYDNLYTIKSPKGPQVCQCAAVTNKRDAFKKKKWC